MKAVVYEGPRQVSTKDVPDAKIERPTDVLVRVTTTNICGSDQHMGRGRTSLPGGHMVLGHEITGEVVEVVYNGQTYRARSRVSETEGPLVFILE